MAATDNVQYQTPPYQPFDRSNGLQSSSLSEWQKMQMKVDLTPSYRLGSSGYGECANRAHHTDTRNTATSLPGLGCSNEGEGYAVTDVSPTSRNSSSHFERSYSALDKKASEYEQRYRQLSQHFAHRHPHPGQPRERHGNVGGSWRHIREVLGYGGSQLVFVDGLVRLYDQDGSQSARLAQPYRRLAHTPLYGASRHDVSSYGRTLKREAEQEAYRPWEKETMPPINDPARPPSNRYKGFYAYKG